MVGWSGETHEVIPKDVSSLADKTCVWVLWYKQTDVLLEQGLECNVPFVRGSGGDGTARHEMQGQRP